MAGGPIFPYSQVPDTTGDIYPTVFADTRFEQAIGLAASFAALVQLEMRWKLPPTLPSGTLKLLCHAISNVATGVVNIRPRWASVAAEERPGTFTLLDEGDAAGVITWVTGDEFQIKELKVTLDADTVVAGESLIMDLDFETDSTLAAESFWTFALIWE